MGIMREMNSPPKPLQTSGGSLMSEVTAENGRRFGREILESSLSGKGEGGGEMGEQCMVADDDFWQEKRKSHCHIAFASAKGYNSPRRFLRQKPK